MDNLWVYVHCVCVCVGGCYSRLWKIKTGKQDENIFSVEKKSPMTCNPKITM